MLERREKMRVYEIEGLYNNNKTNEKKTLITFKYGLHMIYLKQIKKPTKHNYKQKIVRKTIKINKK